MSLITRSALASPDASTAQFAPQITGKIAGEAIDPCAPCYIKASDGLVYMTDATAAGEASRKDGFSAQAVASGNPITLYGVGTRFHYGSGLTIGTNLFAGATAGRLDNAPTVGDWAGCALVISASEIVITRTGPLVKGTSAGIGLFVSTEQTGTGASQNVAHGLGVVPAKVVLVPTDTAPATAGDYTAAQGVHDATNVKATVTSGKKFVVMAFA